MSLWAAGERTGSAAPNANQRRAAHRVSNLRSATILTRSFVGTAPTGEVYPNEQILGGWCG
eukprot:659625-Prymnesium_polylepis.1